jgi:hypothetical protein
MEPDAGVVMPFRQPSRELPDGLFTIKDVAHACKLPQPIISQLVPRTETPAGAMYTVEQLRH